MDAGGEDRLAGCAVRLLEDVAAGRDKYGPERKAVLDRANSFQDDENCRRIVEHFGL